MLDRTLRTWIIVAAGLVLFGRASAVQAGPSNRIGAVAVDSELATTTIRIRGSDTPTFTVYKLERPTRVVVDVASATLAEAVRGDEPAVTYSVGAWAVSQVAAMALEDGSASVRVVATLARPGRYDVKAVGKDVLITIVARDAAPATASADQLAAAQAEVASARTDAASARAEAERMTAAARTAAAKAAAAEQSATAAKRDAEQARATAAAEQTRAAQARAAAATAQRLAASASQADRGKAARELAAAQAEVTRTQRAAADAQRAADRAAAAAQSTQQAAAAELARARELTATATREAARIRADATADAQRTRAEADRDRTKIEAELAADRAAAAAARIEADRVLAAARAEQRRLDGIAQAAASREASAAAVIRAAEARQQATAAAAAKAAQDRAAAEAALQKAAAQRDAAASATGDASKTRAAAAATLADAQARLARADTIRRDADAAKATAAAAVAQARQDAAGARVAVTEAEAARARAIAATTQAVAERATAERARAAAEARAAELTAAADQADQRRRQAEAAAATATAQAKAADGERTVAQRAVVDARASRAAEEQAAAAARAAAQQTIAAARAAREAEEQAAAAARTAAAKSVADAQAAAKSVADARAAREAEERAAATARTAAAKSVADARAAREAEERAARAAAAARVAAEAKRAEAEAAAAALARSVADQAAAATAARTQAAATARAQADAARADATATQKATAAAAAKRQAVAEAALADRTAEVTARRREVERLDAAKAAAVAELDRQQAAAAAARTEREREEAGLATARKARVAEELALAKVRAEAAKAAKAPAPTPAPTPAAAPTANITAVTFAPDAGDHTITIALDGPGATAELVRADGRRAELVLRGAALPTKLTKTLDTSRFGGPVRAVSSYTDRATGQVRVVIDLARDSVPRLDTRPGAVQLRFAAGPRITSQRLPSPVVGGFGATSAPVAQTSVAQLNNKKVYRGATIDLDFKDADIHDLLRALARVGNVNIVVPDEIRATVTVQLKRVPWDHALEVILSSKGLSYRKEGNLYRVGDRKTLDAEDEAEAARIAARVQAEAPTPQVFTLNYANATELSKKLEPLLSPKGKIEVDDRTNSLIVNDVAANRREVVDLAARLDTQTPQISIEARIVEARSGFKREFGIQWGGRASASQAGGNATGLIFPSALGFTGGADDPQSKPSGGITSPSDFAVNLPASGTNGALGMTLGSVGGNVNINLRLSALEDIGTARIISAPKVTVLNNVQANMKQGIKIPISQVSAQGTQTVFVEANLELTVTPYVSQRDCAVVMDVKVNKDEPDFSRLGARGDPTIQSREASTRILVNDGETSVMGGIYTRNTSVTYNKIPLLGDIPVLGWLFKSRKENDERAELLIFITPKITNKALLRCQP